MPKRPLTVVSADPAIRTACAEAATLVPQAVDGITHYATIEELQAAGHAQGLVVVDPVALGAQAIHEWSLSWIRRNPTLVFLLTHGEVAEAEGLARFVGAQGALGLPLDPGELAERLASPFGVPWMGPPRDLPAVDQDGLEANLGARLGALLGEEGEVRTSQREEFLQSITDADSGLFVYQYWEHRLEEEFKRSNRFRFPLGLVSFTTDGLVRDDALLDVASVILLDTRDVDVVSRFDEQTFLALLPHTGPEGARLFADRVGAGLRALDLKDLVGDRVEWSLKSAVAPDSSVPDTEAFLRLVLPEGTAV